MVKIVPQQKTFGGPSKRNEPAFSSWHPRFRAVYSAGMDVAWYLSLLIGGPVAVVAGLGWLLFSPDCNQYLRPRYMRSRPFSKSARAKETCVVTEGYEAGALRSWNCLGGGGRFQKVSSVHQRSEGLALSSLARQASQIFVPSQANAGSVASACTRSGRRLVGRERHRACRRCDFFCTEAREREMSSAKVGSSLVSSVSLWRALLVLSGIYWR